MTDAENTTEQETVPNPMHMTREISKEDEDPPMGEDPELDKLAEEEERLRKEYEAHIALNSHVLRKHITPRQGKYIQRLVETEKIDPLEATTYGILGFLTDGHDLGVCSVAFAKDGRHIAAGSFEGKACVWDAELGEIRRTYYGHKGPVFQVSWCPVGENDRLLTCGRDGTVRLYKKKSGELLYLIQDLTGPKYTVQFCHDGTLFATAGEMGNIKVYFMEQINAHVGNLDHQAKECLALTILSKDEGNVEGHEGPIRKVAWSPMDDLLVSGGDDHMVSVWSIATGGVLVRKLVGHTAAVTDVAFNSRRGRYVVSASKDASVRLWNWKTGECLRILAAHVGPVLSVAFSPEAGGRRIVSGGMDKSICVWETKTGRILHHMKNVHKSYVQSISFRQDGLVFASGSGDRNIGLWRAVPPKIYELIYDFCITSCKFAWRKFSKFLTAVRRSIQAELNSMEEDEHKAKEEEEAKKKAYYESQVKKGFRHESS